MIKRRLLSEQRGAISILAGLSLVFVIASAALAVDIGQATWKKRSLQRLVDVASLDAVRAVGDRRDAVANCLTKATQFAQETATRNDFEYSNVSLGNSLTIETGIADNATKAFTPSTNCALANAVRVTATTRSDHRFMPGSVPLTTQAVAAMDPKATFSIGSRLARLDSSTSPILNSVLGGMLGSSLSLDAVSYNGLADASVTLGAVWTQLGLGTPNQILNSDVTVRNLLTATATALNNQGDPTSVAAATILGTMATQVGTTAHFTFGDLMAITTGDPGAAATAQMDVLSMIGMAASVANGTNLLNLTVPITIPGVASVTAKLGLIEPPQWCVNCSINDSRHTAQARLQFDITLLQKLTVLLTQGTVHLPVYLDAAGATGTLTNIRCAVPSTASDITVHTVAEAVTARVGTATDSSLTTPGTATVNPGQIVSIAGLVTATGTATATMPTSTSDLVIPLNQYRSVGSASNVTVDDQLGSTLSLSVTALSGLVNVTTVTNSLLSILNPVLGTLDTTLFDPLKEALGFLGIEIGGADVTNHDTRCGNRRLIG
jgi:uncharacterized membrane protein